VTGVTRIRQVPADVTPGTYAPRLDADHISLNEVYRSIQGECRHMGRPTTFVRTSHCPLRCTWCDSKYTFTQGTPWTLTDVVDECRRLAAPNVCLTGGEPLAQPQAFDMVRRLAEAGFDVEIETSGSVDVSPVNELAPALRARVCINLDIKCPMSAMTHHNRFENLDALKPQDQLKFVVGDREDYEYARDVIRRHAVPCPIWMNPVWGVGKPRDIVSWVLDDGLDVRVGVQLHKILWGDKRGV
jgi:7-carboxy-7-deazaguanine synthase